MAVEISSGNKFRNFDPIFEFSKKNPKNHDRPIFLREIKYGNRNFFWQQISKFRPNIRIFNNKTINHDRPILLRGNSIWQQKFLPATNIGYLLQKVKFWKNFQLSKILH